MVSVFHFDIGIEPEIHFNINERTEQKIIRNLSKDWRISRCTSDEWFGQDNPDYQIHHWNAEKKKRR